MKIELTRLQLERIIELIDNKYKEDTRNNSFYLALRKKLVSQQKKLTKPALSGIKTIQIDALSGKGNYPAFI